MHNCLNPLGAGMHWQITAGSILWSSLATEDGKSKWIGIDYQATSMIAGWIPASIQHLVHHEQEIEYGTRAHATTIIEKHATSKRLWDYLASIYCPQGISATFGAFQEVLHFQFHKSNNISIQIAEFQGLLNQAAESSLRLEDQISAMIMFNVLSSSYHQLASTIVHSTKTEDFISSLITQSILQETSLRKATWSQRSANLASRIGEPAHAEAHRTTVIWNVLTNVKCSKCGKTNHTTDCCWLLTKKPPFKPSGNSQPQKRQPYAKKQKADTYQLQYKFKSKKKGKGKAGVHFADLELGHLVRIIKISEDEAIEANLAAIEEEETMQFSNLFASSSLDHEEPHHHESIMNITNSLQVEIVEEDTEEPVFET